jgi:hypothetical protein
MRHSAAVLIVMTATGFLGACKQFFAPDMPERPSFDTFVNHQNQTITFRQAVSATTNPCNGEFVVLDGEMMIQYTVVVNENGSMHFEEQTTLQGVKGTGTFGNTYSADATLHNQGEVMLDGGAQVVHTAQNVEVVSHGPAPNFINHYRFHITVSNDAITAMSVDFDPKCQGGESLL